MQQAMQQLKRKMKKKSASTPIPASKAQTGQKKHLLLTNSS